jgi:hypothetical protein
MSERDHDPSDAAELEYTRLRIHELTVEIEEHLKAIGDTVGVEIRVDDMTPQVVDRLAERTIQCLQDSGNPELAGRWSLAFARRKETSERLVVLLGLFHGAEPLADAQQSSLEAAHEAADDAEEEFERVVAEADEWFKSQP